MLCKQKRSLQQGKQDAQPTTTKKKHKVHEKRGAAANLKGPRQINKNTNIIRFRGSLHKNNGYPVH